MNRCRKCDKEFEPTKNDIKKSDYICSECRKLYNSIWRKQRIANGLPVYGSNKWDRQKKEKWIKEYYSRPDIKKKLAERMRQYRNNPENRKKNLARWMLNRMKKKGVIKSEPCTFCGKEKAEAHHVNYDKPLLIVWICKECHTKIHPRTRQSWKYSKAEGGGETMNEIEKELYDSLEEMVNIFEGFAKVVLKDKYVETEQIKRARAVLTKVEGK
jgi:predicted  nucleic acid-binding Zn-ribbon protein